ncbi:hypothetical protein [Nocardia sp. NPDC050710]|uniref:hypothetical protein n=1 Tax=Nocardia sp. NPDC050710 TaxID=3157220 RepID=UPI003407574B
MARMQQWEERERERWSEPAEEDPGERWPQVRLEERGRGRGDAKPIVNPYAIVALVAALLALFPVAIVFGLIAFGHPKGRGMATFAVLLGLAEAGAIAAFVVLTGQTFSDGLIRAEQPVIAQTVAVPATTAAPTTPVPTTTSTPTVTATPQVVGRKGAACPEDQLGQIGQGADGGTLLCLSVAGTSGGYQWSGPFNVGTGQFEAGTKCDPSVSKTGRTTDGRALVCEGSGRSGTWVRWTE